MKRGATVEVANQNASGFLNFQFSKNITKNINIKEDQLQELAETIASGIEKKLEINRDRDAELFEHVIGTVCAYIDRSVADFVRRLSDQFQPIKVGINDLTIYMEAGFKEVEGILASVVNENRDIILTELQEKEFCLRRESQKIYTTCAGMDEKIGILVKRTETLEGFSDQQAEVYKTIKELRNSFIEWAVASDEKYDKILNILTKKFINNEGTAFTYSRTDTEVISQFQNFLENMFKKMNKESIKNDEFIRLIQEQTKSNRKHTVAIEEQLSELSGKLTGIAENQETHEDNEKERFEKLCFLLDTSYEDIQEIRKNSEESLDANYKILAIVNRIENQGIGKDKVTMAELEREKDKVTELLDKIKELLDKNKKLSGVNKDQEKIIKTFGKSALYPCPFCGNSKELRAIDQNGDAKCNRCGKSFKDLSPTEYPADWNNPNKDGAPANWRKKHTVEAVKTFSYGQGNSYQNPYNIKTKSNTTVSITGILFITAELPEGGNEVDFLGFDGRKDIAGINRLKYLYVPDWFNISKNVRNNQCWKGINIVQYSIDQNGAITITKELEAAK